MTPTELRAELERVGLSQRGAARKLEIDERTMRRYCAGSSPIPQVVVLALKFLAQQDHASNGLQ